MGAGAVSAGGCASPGLNRVANGTCATVGNLRRRRVAEFIGTVWLVFGGCGSAVLAAAFLKLGLVGVAFAFASPS